MDGWMDTNRWMVGWMDDWKDEKNRWVVGWLDGWIELNIYTNRWMVGRIKTMKKQMDGWMDRKKNRRMVGWI